MKLLLMASAGGAIGAGLRYLVGVGVMRFAGPSMILPWGTLVVNIVGSFLMGALIESFALKFSGSPELRTFLATGVLGGFTTFSAFSLDAATLINQKQEGLAALYIASSVSLSILALYAGLIFTRQILS